MKQCKKSIIASYLACPVIIVVHNFLNLFSGGIQNNDISKQRCFSRNSSYSLRTLQTNNVYYIAIVTVLCISIIGIASV